MALARILENPLLLLDCVEDNLPSELTNRINHFRNGVFHKRETDATTYLDLNLPGVPLENINVSIDNGLVSVRVEQQSTEETANSYSHHFSGLYRKFTLPSGVRGEDVQANHHHGVLTLSYPNSAQVSNSRRVEITSQ